MGGVARRATMINDIRGSSKNAVLVLDAGSTIFGQRLAFETEGRIIVEAMNAMRYDAMALGQMDLYRGVDVLLERAKEARFSLLSCNIVRLQNGEPVFAPYTVVDRNGVRFGILGVTEPEVVTSPGVRDVAEVLDPAESVLRYLPEVRAKSDVLILLSHLGLDADQALAQAIPGIDVIVGGRSRNRLPAPVIVGETLIVQAGYDGEWLGRLDVAFDVRGQAVDPRVEIIALRPEIADEPALASLVASYKQRFPAPTQPPG